MFLVAGPLTVSLWLNSLNGLLSIIRYINADVCKLDTQEAILDSWPRYDKQH